MCVALAGWMDRVVVWDATQVTRWLECDLGLPVPEDFREAGIDGRRLLGLDEASLSKLLGLDEDTLLQRLSAHIDALSRGSAGRALAAAQPPGATLAATPPAASPVPYRGGELTKLPIRARSPGQPRSQLHSPSSMPKLALKTTPSSGWPGSSASTSCISSPRQSPTSSPRGQLFAMARASSPAGARASSPRSRGRSTPAKEKSPVAWSSFGTAVHQAQYFDTSPRRCLSPTKEKIGPGPASESISPRKISWASDRSAVLGLSEEKGRNQWLFVRSQASPGPKYRHAGKQTTIPCKAKCFDRSPRAGCSTVRYELPPRLEPENPGPGTYHPQYHNLSTFK